MSNSLTTFDKLHHHCLSRNVTAYHLSTILFSFAPNVVLTTTMLTKFPSSDQNLPKVIARRDTRNGANHQTYDIQHNSKKNVHQSL